MKKIFVILISILVVSVIAGLAAWLYFKQFHYTTPLVTAFLFVAIVIFMDVFIVALFIEQSLAMFASFIGTWLPLALIFMATYLIGHYVASRSEVARAV